MKNFTKLLAAMRSIATQSRWFCAIAIAAVIGFTMMGCSGGSSDPDPDPWGSYIDPTSTATLTYSVDNSGVCKITVGGVPQANDETDNWGKWKADVRYSYTAKVNTRYVYEFEAWTASGSRDLTIQYYNTWGDWDREGVTFASGITLTTERKTHTVYGRILPRGEVRHLEFQCADQLGTFYVKILSIKEYQTGTLTITNFSGSPSLTVNEYVAGSAMINNYLDLWFGFDPSVSYYHDHSVEQLSCMPAVVSGASIILDVFIFNSSSFTTFAPYIGSDHIPVHELNLNEYSNKVPITFKNGNATINFGAQME